MEIFTTYITSMLYTTFTTETNYYQTTVLQHGKLTHKQCKGYYPSMHTYS